MKKGIIILLLVTLLFTFLADSGSKESIVICTSLEQFRNDAMQEQLNQRFPDYNIIVMYMATGKAAAKVYAEGPSTEVDILVGLETGYLNKLKGSLADISGASRIPYAEGVTPADNGNLWVTWERQAGSIIVNRTILDKYGLEAPTCYADLLKPEYKGLVAMPDPKSSGTGYIYLKSLVNAWGEDKAFDYFDKLSKNVMQFTSSGSGPINLLVQGEIAIAMGMTSQAVREQQAGQPFEILFFEPGAPYTACGYGIIEGKQDNPAVKEVFDFFYNTLVQEEKDQFLPEAIFKNQEMKVEGYPTDIPYADMAGNTAAEKERLLGIWNKKGIN